jgi:hypothetical protein
MRNIRTFKKWLELGEPEHLVKSNIYVEDISGREKTTKTILLKRLLKDFDYHYTRSDDRRSYQRGKEQEDTIERLVKEIGKDGLKIYRKYISTKESKETTETDENLYSGFSFFPPTPPLSTEEKHLKRTMIYGKVYNGE